MGYFLGFILLVVFVLLLPAILLINQYKRCPSNKILVIYGAGSGKDRPAKCVHGGAAFVLPVIQGYEFLSLEPMTTEIELNGALSLNNIRVNVPSTFTFGISTKPALMNNAAERLLGMTYGAIINQANDIILGQLRLVIATLSIEEINQDREKFLDQINMNVNAELNKIGLEVINVNIRDITDESGYIEAIGKKAAAEAVNKAKVEVAQQDRTGAIGEAEAIKEKEIMVADQLSLAEIGKSHALKEQRVKVSNIEAEATIGEAKAQKEREVQVAQQSAASQVGKTEAEKDKRVQVAGFEAEAVQGENSSQAQIAFYNAVLSEKQAEAKRRGEVAQANAERDILIAEKEKEAAKLQKEEIVKQEIEKQKVKIQAEAEAERLRQIAFGEADSIKAKYLAEAEGIQAVLESKAQGYQKLVSICGDKPELATSFLMIEKVEDVVEKQVEAIKNIKFDKITVWDSGGGNGSATANFMRDLIGSLPAMHDLAKQAGVKLPEYLGVVGQDQVKLSEEVGASQGHPSRSQEPPKQPQRPDKR